MPILRNTKGSFLPSELMLDHEFCFVLHDVLAQALVSGEKSEIFNVTMPFDNDAERLSFEKSDDVFDWLDETGREDERTKLLKVVVLPAVLSDMLHCIYECLECSRKGKLAVAYMLIRKPIQESLYLLESIVLDENDFSQKLSEDPLKLGSSNAGGVEGHQKRIEAVLQAIGKDTAMCSEYLARLRYDKKCEDSFDGICNQAIHLFTSHRSIKTENLNVNFIFSGDDSKMTQWLYLYTRLPYLLNYIYAVVDHILESICLTSPEYQDYIQRRISAYAIMCWSKMDENYKSEPGKKYFEDSAMWLFQNCNENGFRHPKGKDLMKIARTGRFPGESKISGKMRNLRFWTTSKLGSH